MIGTRGSQFSTLMNKQRGGTVEGNYKVSQTNSPRNSVFIKRGGRVLDDTLDSPTALRHKYNRTVETASKLVNNRAMRIIALKKTN